MEADFLLQADPEYTRMIVSIWEEPRLLLEQSVINRQWKEYRSDAFVLFYFVNKGEKRNEYQ